MSDKDISKWCTVNGRDCWAYEQVKKGKTTIKNITTGRHGACKGCMHFKEKLNSRRG